jgi:hypothetical protein
VATSEMESGRSPETVAWFRLSIRAAAQCAGVGLQRPAISTRDAP